MASGDKIQRMWCPLGRISIQRVENGGISAIQTGAFNLAQDGGRVYMASTCVGRRCPHYRRGFNPWGWGRCALSRIDYRPWFLVVAALVSGLLLWREWL